jgi:methylenetetrahydrofolate dehydrogenase (NADP+)/methenyltetrahydrofolate cyclohydrolase
MFTMKKKLRKNIVEKLENLNHMQARALSTLIKKRLLSLPYLEKAEKIGIYYSKNNEVDTIKIIKKYLKSKEIYLPKIKNTNEMEFRKISSLKDLYPGKFNILEPSDKCPTISIEQLDLIIIPCIAVDPNGNRIGRGKGYFDRALFQATTSLKICLAYEFQVLNKIIPEGHDQKIDLIITEKRIISTKKRYPDSKIIDGKITAKKIIENIKSKIKAENINATLAVILVGNDPASELYVKKKKEVCIEVGINFNLLRFPETTPHHELEDVVEKLNRDPNTTGILVQLPLPKHINTKKILNTVSIEKDVDGLSDINQKNLAKKKNAFACCTPNGILKLLEKNKVQLKDKKITLIGYGKLVGKPLATMLQNRGLDFTICTHSTQNLKKQTKQADILISATGVAHLIKSNLVKKNAIIIDAGTAKLDGKLVGDVDFQNVFNKASRITPVPGGVGPMTIAMLVENLIKAHKMQQKKQYTK